MTRALVYARVSSDRQRERHTIGSQLRELPAYAAREGWTVVEVIQDDGISGETVEDRPGFQRVLDLAEQRAFDVLLVIDLDRITRSIRDLEGALIFDALRTAGVRIATPAQGVIDLANEEQDLQVGILRVIAKFEKRKILRRTSRGRREALLQGRRPNCTDPYGLRWVPDPVRGGTWGQYEIVPEQAEIVRRIYREALEGQGAAMIADDLSLEGVPTPRGKSTRWSESTTKKILRSPVYRGELVVLGGKIPPHKVPPIVDEATWHAVRQAVSGRIAAPKRHHVRDWLVAGIVKCGVCGRRMAGEPAHGQTKNDYYRCCTSNEWRKLGLDAPCGMRHLRTRVVDHAVWSRVTDILRDPETLAEACSLSLSAAEPTEDTSKVIARCDRKLADLARHKEVVLGQARRGRLSEDELDRELEAIARDERTLRATRETAANARHDAEGRRATLKRLEDAVAALGARLDATSFEERRRLVRLVIPPGQGAVTLHPDGSIDIRGVIPMAGETPLTLRATA